MADRARYNFTIPTKLDENVVKLSEKLDMSKGEVVRRSIAFYAYIQEILDQQKSNELAIGDGKHLIFTENQNLYNSN